MKKRVAMNINGYTNVLRIDYIVFFYFNTLTLRFLNILKVFFIFRNF